jgi:transcriptional regulator with XRE-family HTH domain
MITQSNEVAKLMIERRKQLRLSQTKLSTKLGFSEKNGQYVSNIERGRCQFPTRFINKLANVLEVSEETIIELMTNDYREAVKREVLNASELPNQATNQL